MWDSIKSFLLGVGKNVLSVLLIYMKSEAVKFVADVKPIALNLISAASKMDLDNAGKFEYVKNGLIAALKEKGIEYKDRWLSQAIEICYEIWLSETKELTSLK